MTTPFLDREASLLTLLTENYDPNGKHMEYRDQQGQVFARMAKVYKGGNAFIRLFRSDPVVHGEMKAIDNGLLLTTLSARGKTDREYKVDVFQPDGTLTGTLYDAPFGADFEDPSGALLGRARRPTDQKIKRPEVIHTYTNASEQVVGTCAQRYPRSEKGESLSGFHFDLLDAGDFYSSGGGSGGRPVQFVALTAPVPPTLHLFLHLFPALQHLRFSRNW